MGSWAYFAAALLTGAIVMALLAGYRRLPALERQRKLLFRAALAILAAAGTVAILLAIFRNAKNPPQWDFLLFWINGAVAAHGQNYYDPRLATALAQPFHPTDDFIVEGLARPFLYPPPSILWFLPLGLFSLHTAAVLWFAFQFLCLARAVVILSRHVLLDGSSTGLLLTGALAALIYGTYLNIRTGQTVFLILLLMALFFRDRDKFMGGVWLALGILAKPLIAVFFIWLLLKKRWMSLLLALATLAAAAGLTLTIFGGEVFRSYFTIDFSALPSSSYTEPENQSLLAWVLRITGGSAPQSIPYIVIALLLVAVTLWRIRRLADSRDDIAFAVTLVLGLLVYPGSLRSYSVLLLIPILILCRERLTWPLALAYALMLPGQGYYVFFASALIWMLLTFTPAIAHENAPGRFLEFFPRARAGLHAPRP
jgi:hypothetical protein